MINIKEAIYGSINNLIFYWTLSSLKFVQGKRIGSCIVLSWKGTNAEKLLRFLYNRICTRKKNQLASLSINGAARSKYHSISFAFEITTISAKKWWRRCQIKPGPNPAPGWYRSLIDALAWVWFWFCFLQRNCDNFSNYRLSHAHR